MAAVYAALVGKLTGPAKDHLVKDQVRWLGDREPACAGDDRRRRALPEDALRRSASRPAGRRREGHLSLRQRAVARQARQGQDDTLQIDARYPQFDGARAPISPPSIRPSPTRAQKGADEATPPADDTADRSQIWTYEQGFALYRPGADAVAVATSFYGFTGGAHGYRAALLARWSTCAPAAACRPAAVFKPARTGCARMADIVGADLKRQFVERPGFDDALEPAKLDKLMTDPQRYLLQGRRAGADLQRVRRRALRRRPVHGRHSL